jgi:hypothetical protein
MKESRTDVSMWAVVQTADTFRYPAGKTWGPYIHKCDAEARVSMLRHFKGNGRIVRADGPPCAETRNN